VKVAACACGTTIRQTAAGITKEPELMTAIAANKKREWRVAVFLFRGVMGFIYLFLSVTEGLQ